MQNAINEQEIRLKAEGALKKKEFNIAKEYYQQIEKYLVQSDFRKFCLCLIELKAWDKAIEVLKKWEDTNPKSTVLYSMIGHVYTKKKQIEEAEEAYRKGLELNPKPSMLCLLGKIIASTKKDESINCFKKAIELDSNYSEAYYHLGLLYQDGSVGDSEKYLSKAISLDPDYVEALAELGFLFIRQKRYIEAEEKLRKALEINGNYLWATVYLANLLWETKQFVEAEEMYKRAIKISPEYDEVYKWYGDFLNGQGRVKEADNYYKIAKDMSA